jgi:hypothetical protein
MPPQTPSPQGPALPDIDNLEGLERNYYRDVRWFKAVVLLAAVLIVFLTTYTLKRVAGKANVVQTVIGLAMWIIVVPMFTLTFYILVALASEKAIANKWYEWPLHLCLVGCCWVFASGCAWYDTDFTTEVNGVGVANGVTIMTVVILYAVICLFVSQK